MQEYLKLAVKAESEIKIFYATLEMNPSKILLINAVILFDDLLRKGLTRCFGYKKKRLPIEFSLLTSLAEEKFKNPYCNEHWQLLKSLSTMRNHVAHRQSSNILFGSIIPDAWKQKFQADFLQTNFMVLLIPQLADFWKELIKMIYTFVYMEVMIRVEFHENEALANETKIMLDHLMEWTNSPEGKVMLQQLENILGQPASQEEGAHCQPGAVPDPPESGPVRP